MVGLVLTLASSLLSAQSIPNQDFETLVSGRPTGWRSITWSGSATFSVGGGRSGGHAAHIAAGSGADAAWQVAIPVRPNARYRLTAWIRTEDVAANTGRGALVNLHGRKEFSQAVTGTTDWQQVEILFDSGRDDAILVNALVGYFGQSRGSAWFDDFQLTMLEYKPWNPSVTIDRSKKGAPISPYIYSQFIEHLGRCIYGGIWAEMLEDRKFFFTPGTQDSPWKIKAGSVAVDRVKPFSGATSPRFVGSIAQGGLWLQKGRRYVGRVWHRGVAGRNLRLTLNWGGGSTEKVIKQLTTWQRTDFEFVAGEDTRTGELTMHSVAKPAWIGAVSLMPADNVFGMRKEVLAALRELNAPLYRWPGGNFVSGYDWLDGIGDPDRRPTRFNPAWQGIEPNDFGTHEFLKFCELIKTEPMIVVNTGFGDATSAAAWVEYVTAKHKSATTDQRVANGKRTPWKVDWWGVGNEMFGPWQLGYMAIDQYVRKHREVVRKMRAVKPDLKLIGVGEVGGDWSKKMLQGASEDMDLISEHFYCQEKPGVASHVDQIPEAIRNKVAAHRQYRRDLPELKGKRIGIAMDEWNYWYGPHVFGELGTRYFVKDGLGIAAGVHEYARASDIVLMANYAQTVNVIGCIKTNPTQVCFETTGLVLKLYRNRFGTIPLKIGGDTQPLDVMAALTKDGKLTLSVINPTAESQTLKVSWSGAPSRSRGTRWIIAHDDPMAHNDPSRPNVIEIESVPEPPASDIVQVRPYSINLIEWP
ncbi:MAG: hypothetical protein HONBIEJF_01528 [Fimbriimonadaceae bacterium]|nr:hypothetical protein [Fimbriimonadaceae bacterium]